VLCDTSPTVILTTSAVVGNATEYAQAHSSQSAPAVIEIDLLDLDSPGGSGAGGDGYLATAYLQYTSGSTRQPAAVMVSHRNQLANFEQLMSDYFAAAP